MTRFDYYIEGDPNTKTAPDVFVMLDHGLKDRRSCVVWKQGRAPDFAPEVISPPSDTRNAEYKIAGLRALLAEEWGRKTGPV